jgi:hypothetical protein
LNLIWYPHLKFITMYKIENFKLDELKKKCIEFGLKTYGTKQALCDRLNKYGAQNNAPSPPEIATNNALLAPETATNPATNPPSPPETTSNNPTTSKASSATLEPEPETDDEIELHDVLHNESEEDDDFEDLEEVIEGSNKRKKIRIRLEYLREPNNYENKESALAQIESENTWYFDRFRPTIHGDKQSYVCKHRSGDFLMRLYILMHQNNESCSIWRTNMGHEHSEKVQTDRGLNLTTRQQIDQIYSQNTKTPLLIYLALRQRMEPILPKRFDNDEEVIIIKL